MNCLRIKNFLKMYEHIQPFTNYMPREEKAAGANKVLVIAPNQIDETIACSGAVSQYAKSGSHIEILYCTHDTAERMKEAEKAASILGSQKNHFIQSASGTLTANRTFENSLVMLINKINPEIVFIPFWADRNSDSVAVSKAFINIKNRIDLNFTVYAYSVWTPLNPNCLFNISAEWEKKKKAIECYTTQKNTRDYLKIAQSINQYWAQILSPAAQYAEVFFKSTAQEYIFLGKKIF
jgi:LmbE family N-acetylglucosaminyl deacetylase